MKMEAICSFETLVLKRTTRRHTPEDSIVRCYRHENKKIVVRFEVFTATLTRVTRRNIPEDTILTKKSFLHSS
jgi:hypothetical protein